MATMHLIIGPVGAGKSTFARRLSEEHSAVNINLDEWMARLFRPDRPDEGVMGWYVERVERCIDQIWALTKSCLAAEANVVLELGLIRRADRLRFFQRVREVDAPLTIHVVEADRDVRRERVERRNRERGDTFAMEVLPEVFELASDLWEPLDEAEDPPGQVLHLET